MKKIPIVLEQYECIGCKYKWYINTEDKIDNKMTCPYGCECKGDITRKFDMMIHKYEEYVQGEMMNLQHKNEAKDETKYEEEK